MGDFVSDEFGQRRKVSLSGKRKQRKALKLRLPGLPPISGALVLSILFFIPLAPLGGAIRGIRQVTGGEGRVSGTLACMLGLAITIAQAFIGLRAVSYVLLVGTGPETALATGLDGGITDFGTAFGMRASEVDRPSTAQFLAELRNRYGILHEVALLDEPMEAYVREPEGARTYTIHFDRASVQAEVVLAVDREPGLGWLASSMTSMKIFDARDGDLVYPVPAAREAAIVSANQDAASD